MVADPDELMRLAIETCRKGLAADQSPFGCAIVLDGQILAQEHNTVVRSTDITAHAEMNAIWSACRTTGTIFLTGAHVAATCEPCPMCMAALHWARVDTVYYGATISDAHGSGFNELTLAAADLLRLGGSSVRLIGGVLADECRDLFTHWHANPKKQSY